jgi:hypothetical protein
MDTTPSPLDPIATRPFSFHPAIAGIEHNDWEFRQSAWSEILVANRGTAQEIWIPRRYFGAVSRVEEPVPVVGLTCELEYTSGTKLTQPGGGPGGGGPGGGRGPGNGGPDGGRGPGGGGPGGGRGPGPQGGRAGERTNQTWQDQTAGFYYVVVDAMLKTGFTRDEIGRIGGQNFLRIFGEAPVVF